MAAARKRTDDEDKRASFREGTILGWAIRGLVLSVGLAVFWDGFGGASENGRQVAKGRSPAFSRDLPRSGAARPKARRRGQKRGQKSASFRAWLAASPACPWPLHLAILPLDGAFANEEERAIQDAFRGIWPVEIRLLPRRRSLDAALRPWKEIVASEVWPILLALRPLWADRVLGIVEKPLLRGLEASPKGSRLQPTKAIAGLAEAGGRAALLSRYRISAAKNHTPLPNALSWTALLRHEIGHLLSLPHCSEKTCVMRQHGEVASHKRPSPSRQNAPSSWPVDFCPRCRAFLQQCRLSSNASPLE